jgi:hypothetical protein
VTCTCIAADDRPSILHLITIYEELANHEGCESFCDFDFIDPVTSSDLKSIDNNFFAMESTYGVKSLCVRVKNVSFQYIAFKPLLHQNITS